MVTDIVGDRTLKSQWNETVQCAGKHIFLEYISNSDEITQYTYEEFDLLVRRTAQLLLAEGIRPGQLVALQLHNSPQYLMCWLALAQIGAVAVPMNEHYKCDEVCYVLEKCEIKAVIAEEISLKNFTEKACGAKLEKVFLVNGNSTDPNVVCIEDELNQYSGKEIPDIPVRSDSMAVILFTSGTTCRPKGAVYTHCNVVYGGLFHAAQIGMRAGDRFLSAMPCYHMDFQEMACMPVICMGGTLIMVEHYSAHRFWRQVCERKADFTDTMSIMNRTMLMQPVQPWEKEHHLKQIYFSMGLSDCEKEQFEQRFNVNLLNSYGMTETVSAVTCSPVFGDKHWPSVGRAALSYEIKIVDSQGCEVPAGEKGEICVRGIRGRTLVAGYYREPEATAKLFPEEGWLHSGDLGWLDEDGWLFFEGRMNDMIKRAGENVSASEVEYTLTSHPQIADAAVIGVPDPIRDQAVAAFVLPMNGEMVSAEEVIDYCAERLAKFKVPTVVRFVDAFERTSTGKIKKELLRRNFVHG